MAAILTNLVPFKKKNRFNHDRILNTRWGDAAISAPMHDGRDAGASNQQEESPDLDKDLPPTPPQSNAVVDDIYIVHDEEGTRSDGIAEGQERENASINITLPWKRRKDSSGKKQPRSTTSAVTPKFAPSKRVEPMPALATAEAAAAVYPYDTRISSPVSRATPTTPVLSFRTRLADPNLADILSPVVEGFAKHGPSSRATPPIPSTREQAGTTEKPSTSSSPKSSMARRENATTACSSEGFGDLTMCSQATTNEQLADFNRPMTRGIGSTARMRASSRPRAYSRGPRSSSDEPDIDRPGSIESYTRRAPSNERVERRAPYVEPIYRRTLSVDPPSRRAPLLDSISRRAASIEPHSRSRAPSLEPTVYRDKSARPYYRQASSAEPILKIASSAERACSRNHSIDRFSHRGQSVEPFTRRDHSVEPVHYRERINCRPVIPTLYGLEPVRRRAPSMDPGRRRAPSIDPLTKRGFSVEPTPFKVSDEEEERSRRRAPFLGAQSTRRAISREPRGRRGASAGPKQRVRFQSEAIRTHRRHSFSSNDGSDESDEDRHELRPKYFSRPTRTDPDSSTHYKPRRGRSIASLKTSPTLAVFNVSQTRCSPPALTTSFDSTSSRAGVIRPVVTPVEKHLKSRDRSTSRARSVYTDVQEEFSTLAREVRKGGRGHNTSTDTRSTITRLPCTQTNSSLRTASPIDSQAGIGTMLVHANTNLNHNQHDSSRNDYTSDSSHSSLACIPVPASGTRSSNSDRHYDTMSSTAYYEQAEFVFGSSVRDPHHREDRERAREKVARKLELEREKQRERGKERIMAMNAFESSESDCDSGSESESEKMRSGADVTRNVFGGSLARNMSDSEQPQVDKVLVPNYEEIWG